jgi:redox-sensitive bicupin YhaK (pirin superfamily)
MKEVTMITVRKSEERGRSQLSWLDSHHTFSFAHYYDPAHLGFASLRVINDDRVVPGGGFATHSHRDMEIISYVLDGALEHKDSLGHGSVIHPGDVQRMSAGTGVSHSEYNASDVDPVHFLQIWIEPNLSDVTPSYEQTRFAPEERRGQLRLIASNDGRDGSVTIHQDATVYATLLSDGDEVTHRPDEGRNIYVHVASGQASLNGQLLNAGDGAQIREEPMIRLGSPAEGEVLLFDLA